MVMWVQTIHMRWFVYLTLSLSSALPEMVVAQTLRLPNPLPAGGETFVDPVYDSHDASRLYITHKTGVASVRIAHLPDTLQQKLGYSANNAQVAESAFAKRQAEAEAQQAIEFDNYLKQLKAAERKREEAFRKAAPTYAVTFTRSKTPRSYSSPPSSPPRKLTYKEKQAQARLDYYQGMSGSMDRPSAMASREEKEAYTAQEVGRGNLPSSELPEAYGGRPKRGTQRSRQTQLNDDAQVTRTRGGVPSDPSIFPAPNNISPTPVAPRFINTHDSAGNFHTGWVQPTGFYNGTVHSPRGGAGHVTGHVSPSGSFQGTDNHGSFYNGY